jgi:hypothetical protein
MTIAKGWTLHQNKQLNLQQISFINAPLQEPWTRSTQSLPLTTSLGKQSTGCPTSHEHVQTSISLSNFGQRKVERE